MASGLAISWSRYSGSSSDARRWSSSSSSCSSGRARRSARLSARFDIGSRRVLDRLELAFARDARALRLHRRGVLLLQPFEPVRPPAALVLLGTVDELLERGRVLVASPILILLRRGRVHHAGNMARA